MIFDVITIFPDVVEAYFQESILKRARMKKLAVFNVHNLRNFTHPKDIHKTVDDRIYGGGPGMLLKIEPLYGAIKKIVKKNPERFSKKVLKNFLQSVPSRKARAKIILLDPKGKIFDQKMARRFSQLDQIVLVCGRYEGFDARIEKCIDEKISVGKYVLSGGELPALTIIEATARLLPGVLGNQESLTNETHNELLGKESIEPPHYTRPELFIPARGIHWTVPRVLLSGDHKKIETWRKKSVKMKYES